MDSHAIAQTILDQLGGKRFMVMTGVRALVSDGNSLRFKLPRGAKDGINWVRIELTPSDTYTVTFGKARGLQLTVVHTAELVYADNLRELFTKHTGLDTSL